MNTTARRHDRTNPGTHLHEPVSLDRTSISSDLLADEYGFLRNQVRLVQADATALERDIAGHHQVHLGNALAERTELFAQRSVEQLLDLLADRGFSWRAIARLADVSVPALRKWRLNQSSAGPDRRRRLAGAAALCEILEHDHQVGEVASWLDLPLDPDGRSGLTSFDLVVVGDAAQVIEIAAHHTTTTAVLDEADPGWRDRPRHEIAEGADGMPAIRVATESN